MYDQVFVVGQDGGVVQRLHFVEPDYTDPDPCDGSYLEVVDERYVQPDPYRTPRMALVSM